MLLNGIRVIVKNPEGPCFLTVLFSHLRTQQEDSLPNTGKGLIRTQPGRWSLIWDFMPSGTLRYKLLLVKPHILWHSATAAMTQTVVLLKLPWKPWKFLKIFENLKILPDKTHSGNGCDHNLQNWNILSYFTSTLTWNWALELNSLKSGR